MISAQPLPIRADPSSTSLYCRKVTNLQGGKPGDVGAGKVSTVSEEQFHDLHVTLAYGLVDGRVRVG